MLAGHSCGATLALQVVMQKWSAKDYDGKKTVGVMMPQIVLGVEGLYDLPLLRDTHRDIPMYQQFLDGAFGADEEDWKRAHPVGGRLSETWKNGRTLVIAHSKGDELVDWVQVERMQNAIRRESVFQREDLTLELSGKHFAIVDDGTEMAWAIEKAISVPRT